MTQYKLLLALLLVTLLGACTNTIKQEQETGTLAKMAKPEYIMVSDFVVNAADIKINSSVLSKLKRKLTDDDEAVEKSRITREVTDALATELEQRITSMGFNVRRTDSSQPLLAGAMLVTGKLLNIDEGNNVRRGIIGLGAGQSSIDSEVQLFAPSNSSQQALYAFKSHVDSGKMPGLAIGPAGAAVKAGKALAGGVKAYRSSETQLAAQLAEEIAAKLSAYFVRQGWGGSANQ